MTAIAAPAPTATTAHRFPVLRATAISAVAGAAATSVFAAAASAAGVSFHIAGQPIPVLGFANLTVIGAVLGGLLLVALNRFSAQPRRRFLQATVALTALSCVPDLIMPDDVASMIALVTAHALAAVVIVPILARAAR